MIKSFAIKSTGILLAVLLAFSAVMFTGCQSSSSEKESKSSAISVSPKSSKKNTETTSANTSATTAPVVSTADAYEGDYKIPDNAVKGTITVKDYGDIEFALLPDVAPITVENFEDLVKSKFYDGLTFHRIMDGFMIQGGDPKGDGTGGNDKKIKGEFSSNGVNNPLKHVRGVMSMARSTPPDSASSQFFIVQQDSNFLDGQYAAFGIVTKGMSVVDKICKDAKPTDNNGTIPKDQQPVIEKITLSDK